MQRGTSCGRYCLKLALTVCLLAGTGVGVKSAPATEEETTVIAAGDGTDFHLRDDFDGRLALKWKPVRHDPTHVSLDKHAGKLTIVTQRGTIHATASGDSLGQEAAAKNLYMLSSPAPDGADFVITTRVVSFAPKTSWQQAGLMIYNDDDNYLKCDLEWSRKAPSGMAPVFLRETDKQTDAFGVEPAEKCSDFWLRITKRGKLYEYAYSPNSKDYSVVGERRWGDGAPQSVGIFAKNGDNPLAGEIDVQFDFFEIRSLTDAEQNEPAYLERKRLQGTWDVIGLEKNGRALKDLALSQFTFDDGEILVREKDKTLKAEYRLEVSETPKEIILVGLFSQQGRPVPAIYSVGDTTLKICLDPRPNGAAPLDFTTEQRDGRLSITLHRAEKTD